MTRGSRNIQKSIIDGLTLSEFLKASTLVLLYIHTQSSQCTAKTGYCRLQISGKMQTKDFRHFKYISCYFHYRVLTVKMTIQANCSESLHSLSLNITLILRLNVTQVSLKITPV